MRADEVMFIETYDALGSVLVLMLKRMTESCQGTCPRPHPAQQVSKTGRPTMKSSPNPGAVPTPMLSPGKQAGGPESNSHVNFKNWEPFTESLKDQSLNPLLVHSFHRRQIYFFPFFLAELRMLLSHLSGTLHSLQSTFTQTGSLTWWDDLTTKWQRCELQP